MDRKRWRRRSSEEVINEWPSVLSRIAAVISFCVFIPWQTVTSHHLRPSLACPFVFTFVTLLMDAQCKARTLIHTHT